MPNHVVNEIRIHNTGAVNVRSVVSGERGVIDFRTLLPLPKNYWPGSVSSREQAAFPGTHLDAARETWGTKWNAYALSDESFRVDGDDVVLTFETAWAPPRGWVVAVFSTLECDITHYWQDEGSEAVLLEKYTFTDGDPRWRSEEVEHGSPDHRRLFNLQWGVETPAELEAEA